MWKPTISSDELYHHGILGQQHGVRNGPPYPLDAEDHSAKEKKEGWADSLKRKHRKKKETREYRKAYKKVGKALKKDKEFQEKLGNYIINSQKRSNDVASRSKPWGEKEDYYQYKDRRRKEWANSNENKQDLKELNELLARGEEIAKKKLGKAYDTKVESTLFDKSKSRGERIMNVYKSSINYNPYTWNSGYMTKKTRRKIVKERS